MNRLTLFLAIVTILAPFTAAQFSANFTRVLAGYGPRSVILTPANITEADGTQYWDIERGSIDAPEGEWTLDLLNIDGSVVSLENQNNDLVVVEPNGNTTSVSSRIPPLLGITGPELIQVISNNVQLGVESAYADPSTTRVTNAQANAAGRTVVDQISAASSLPPFFLAPFRAQAYQQINQSLANAQATSAAYNRSLGGDNGEGENPTPVGNTVALNYNFSSLNINDLDNVKEIIAIAGSHTVDVVINGEVEGIEGDAFGSYLSSLNVMSNLEEGEWQLTWVDDNGENHVVLNQNGDIVVVNPDGSLDDVTETAGYWANAETSDIDLAVGNAIQDFVDAVLENQVLNTNETVTINVGPQGLNWTYPASVEGAL